MKLSELLEILNEINETTDEDPNVLFASQPNYPFEYSIAGVVSRYDALKLTDADVIEGEISDIFILEGSQLRYASKRLWDD